MVDSVPCPVPSRPHRWRQRARIIATCARTCRHSTNAATQGEPGRVPQWPRCAATGNGSSRSSRPTRASRSSTCTRYSNAIASPRRCVERNEADRSARRRVLDGFVSAEAFTAETDKLAAESELFTSSDDVATAVRELIVMRFSHSLPVRQMALDLIRETGALNCRRYQVGDDGSPGSTGATDERAPAAPPRHGRRQRRMPSRPPKRRRKRQ